jgi:hypothetical protein
MGNDLESRLRQVEKTAAQAETIHHGHDSQILSLAANDAKILEKLDAIHFDVVALNTKWNGGPGHWEICKNHESRIVVTEKKTAKLTYYLILAMGAAGAVEFLINHQALLKLLSKS